MCIYIYILSLHSSTHESYWGGAVEIRQRADALRLAVHQGDQRRAAEPWVPRGRAGEGELKAGF